ncbi:hypothetical protein GCM10009131_31950 [Morganella psychrotolerans]
MTRLPVKDSTVITMTLILCITFSLNNTGYFSLSVSDGNILVQTQSPHKGN